MTRVSTGSRLHFGLFRLPPAGPWPSGERFYGGVGLMIERPGVGVVVQPANDWSASGPSAERALNVARRLAAARPALARPHSIKVESCATEHAGLGTGTQLTLAVARSLAASAGMADLAVTELARLTGRGRRSAVGVHGFVRGGLLIDGGKQSPEELAPLVARADFHAEWRVVLLTPADAGPCWHGRGEDEAIAGAGPTADDELRRLAMGGMLPALAAGDLPGFADAVYEFNVRAGEPFRAAQGGTYCGEATAAIVAWLRERSVRGAGQSSWGPTVFGIVGNENEAEAIAAAARRKWGDAVSVVVTAARHRGAELRLSA
jgi:beta-RFAP synthase